MLRTKSLLVLILISASLHSAEAPVARPVAMRDTFLEKLLIKELCPIDVTQELKSTDPLPQPEFLLDLKKARVIGSIDSIIYDEKAKCHYVTSRGTPCWGDGKARLYKVMQDETAQELFKGCDDTGAICSVHSCSDNSLITTHSGGKVYRWNVTKNSVEKIELLDFDLPGHLSGATPIVSDLTDDEQTLYLGINKKYGNNQPETLCGQIVCHNFANPTKRKFIFDPTDCALITHLKALPGNQIVCARLNRPHIIPMCDPYKRHLTEGPLKSTIQLLDARSGDKLLQFTFEGECPHMSAFDNGESLQIQAHNRLLKMASLRKLETADRQKLRALTKANDHIENQITVFDAKSEVLFKPLLLGRLSNEEKHQLLTMAVDDSQGIELVPEYSESKEPQFFTWKQICENRHTFSPEIIERMHAGGTNLLS